MAEALLRLKQVLIDLACGKTKFNQNFRHHSDADPFVPGTTIPRLRPIPFGERNIAFLAREKDALITALAALRDAEPPPQPASKPPDALRGTRDRAPKRNAVKREQAFARGGT